MGLLRDCLMGLPCLHTLGIANEDEPIEWDAFKSISRVKLGFPNITKVAIPIFAHPILALLPKVEEIIFFCSVARDNASPALRKLRKPNVQERSGKIEPVLKSITIVSPAPGLGCAPGTYITSSSLVFCASPAHSPSSRSKVSKAAQALSIRGRFSSSPHHPLSRTGFL